MSYVALTALCLVWTFGGILDSINRAISDDSAITGIETTNAIISGVGLISIDDVALNDASLNTEVAGGVTTSRDWWDAVKDALLFDYSWWEGYTNIIRWVLLAIAAGVLGWVAIQTMFSIVGAIRGVT